MPLRYSLTENPLTANLGEQSAVVYINQVHTLEDLIDLIVSRGSTVTRAEVLSVFEELCLAVEQSIKEGNAVNTPLFMVVPSIKGRFADDSDKFDTERHEIKLRMKPGLRLRRVPKVMNVEKIPGGKRMPIASNFYDNTSQTRNSMITPGGAGRINGTKLKFNENATEQGIFFVHQNTGSTTRVNSTLIRNMPRELIFLIPAGMPPGNYKVEIRTVFQDAKVLRTGILPYSLTIA
jgi:hypothetical protein